VSRRLLSTRRLIPLDRLDEYLADWNALRAAAEAAGGRAWMFRGAGHQDHFIEFLEWREDGGEPLPERAQVLTARSNLDDGFGAGNVDEWEEVPEA
jgi:hypothetical protein